MPTRDVLSFCRICMGTCGTVVTVDENDRMVSIRGDHDDPQTMGFACAKGLRAVESHNGPTRILRPLKRMPDGTFATIGVEQALDEIAERLRTIRDTHGPESVAGYKGGGGFFTASALTMLNEWLQCLGSPKAFSSATIDQSAKRVAAGRMGTWGPGKIAIRDSEVLLLVGSNPFVSVSSPFDTRNPVKRMKQARARGMKLILIDPRRTETAEFADILIRPLAGEDTTVIAGLLHIILAEGWEDKEFCAAHVGDMDALRDAVSTFTPSYVAKRAQVNESDLFAAAKMFASLRGTAQGATGPNMGPFSNVAVHLIECLNVICGRFIREGEPIPNPGALLPRYPRKARVTPARREWERGPKSRVDGSGMLGDEMMTGIMTDEILQPGEGQVRALFVHGGNPASAVPDQRKIVKALRQLDLLVCIEPTMTITAQLADYILPPFLPYERADFPIWLFEMAVYLDEPYTRYTPPVAAPPADSELVHDAHVFWGLAKRLGIQLTWLGTPLDMTTPPVIDDLLEIVAKRAGAPFDELKQAARGMHVGEPQYAEPAEPDWTGRFSLMPPDVRGEVDGVLAQRQDDDFPYRLAVRRLRDVFNSVGRELASTRKRITHNRVHVNPDDLASLAITPGDEVEVQSHHGTIVAVAHADPSLRTKVISIAHGFGGLPDEGHNRTDYWRDGVSPNLLLDGDKRESINAMPWMSGIQVALRRHSSH